MIKSTHPHASVSLRSHSSQYTNWSGLIQYFSVKYNKALKILPIRLRAKECVYIRNCSHVDI